MFEKNCGRIWNHMSSALAAFYPPKMRFPPRSLQLTSPCFSYTCEPELTCNFEAARFLKYISFFLPSMQASFFYLCKKKRERKNFSCVSGSNFRWGSESTLCSSVSFVSWKSPLLDVWFLFPSAFYGSGSNLLWGSRLCKIPSSYWMSVF